MTEEQKKALGRKEQGEETRRKLLDTGARLFALNGYHGVGMRTLAAEAGVNLATVGYHFGGKPGLYEAIIREIIVARDHFFPTTGEVEERMRGIRGDAEALASAATWYVGTLVKGILGKEEHIWPVFILSRELAQPSALYPLMEKGFFEPSFKSLYTFAAKVLPPGTDHEELVITAHCIIGMIVKFLEGYMLITKRLGWENYQGHGLEKISAVLCKRIRGFLGLPMEDA